MDWIRKYKLYHIPFWAAYHFLWWSFYDGDPIEVASSILSSASVIKYLFYVVLQAVGVYFCLYHLMPTYLDRGKYWSFLSYLLCTIGIVSIALVGGYYLSAFWAQENVYELYNIDPPNAFSFVRFNTLPSTVSVFTLALSIKLAKNWILAQRRRQELEKEKLETELKFLRSQFNPHFLFNTINSVFFLIDKNPVMASETLAKFSDLLRYQLYECNEAQIPLKRELSYIKSYIALEEIRLNENYKINATIEEVSLGDQLIAPFILMPFIENAFKHVSHHANKINWVNVEISVDHDSLLLKTSNSVSKNYLSCPGEESYKGIGLQNVKRRLAILYPDQSDLEIYEDESSYSAILKIQLQSLPSAQPAFA